MAGSGSGLAPVIKYSLAKYVEKGEDAWAQQPAADCTLPAAPGPQKLPLFGVFDGHGGKQAATFASRHLLSRLQTALTLVEAKVPGDTAMVDATREDCVKLRARLETAGVSAEELAACEAQDKLAAALPGALVSAFAATEADFLTHTQESGTTATVALVAGWEVLVANVGDSLAYLDTGAEVVQVSGNHRLDDSKPEQERIATAGSEVAQSEVDGSPVGPLRVWPGGLAMGRSIGDVGAGAAVLSEPEIRQVRASYASSASTGRLWEVSTPVPGAVLGEPDIQQVTLPSGGGRLLLASDGLWDLVKPKTAAHHIRDLPATRAAAELVQMASKNRKPRDDITVLVVDIIPPQAPADTRLPPALDRASARRRNSTANGNSDGIDVFHPLISGSGGWRCDAWQQRLAVVEARQQQAEEAAYAEQRTAERAAEREAAASSAASSSALAAAAAEAGDASSGSTSESSDSDIQYASEMHRQLATLAVDPEELAAMASAGSHKPPDAAIEDAGWEDVPVKMRRPGSTDDDVFRELAVPGSVAARHQPSREREGRVGPQHGRGRGRSRDGSRGGRGRHLHLGLARQDHGHSQTPGQANGTAISKPVDAANGGERAATAGEAAGSAELQPEAKTAAGDALAPRETAEVLRQLPAGRGRHRGRGRSGRHLQDGFFGGYGPGPHHSARHAQQQDGFTGGRGRGRFGSAEQLEQQFGHFGRGAGRTSSGRQQRREPAADAHLPAASGNGDGKANINGHGSPMSAQQLFDALQGGGGGGNVRDGAGEGGHFGRHGAGRGRRAGRSTAGRFERTFDQTNSAAAQQQQERPQQQPPGVPQPQQMQQQHQQHWQPRQHHRASQQRHPSLQFGTMLSGRELPTSPQPRPQSAQLQFGSYDDTAVQQSAQAAAQAAAARALQAPSTAQTRATANGGFSNGASHNGNGLGPAGRMDGRGYRGGSRHQGWRGGHGGRGRSHFGGRQPGKGPSAKPAGSDEHSQRTQDASFDDKHGAEP